MIKDYVQEYVSLEKEHWWFKVREKIILKCIDTYLKPNNNIRILNVGAAGGRSSEWLSKYGEVTSVEYDKDFLDYLRTQNIAVTEASITKLPFGNESFDLVCAFDVIEHVEDDKQATKELFRVCKNDGAVCITVPATPKLWSAHDDINGHYRRYTRSSLDSLLQSNILKAVKISYFNSFLYPLIRLSRKMEKKSPESVRSDFSKNKSLGKIFGVIFSLEKFMLPRFSLPFGVSLIALCKKQIASTKPV